MRPLNEYSVVVFDCDGVLLNSNKIKTDAFYESTVHYGVEKAEKFRDYHTENGGVSRYKKFQYFFSDILNRQPNTAEYEHLLDDYANRVKHGLLTCQIAEGLEELKNSTGAADWMVASGGDQAELRDVFEKRCLAKYFNLGVFGSPTSKEQIIEQQLSNRLKEESILFIGDSKYDFLVAKRFNLDFSFIYEWTEFSNWRAFADENKIKCFEKLSKLISI